MRNGRLRFESEIEAPFDRADAYFIAVGTPPLESGAADTSAVKTTVSADTIAKVAKAAALVVVKSTVPVGTCDAVQERVSRAALPLEVVSNPEFLKEGDAVSDFFKPDRVVLGAKSEAAQNVLRDLSMRRSNSLASAW